MNNTKKLKLNSILGLLYQLVVLISGLIIPRFILMFYGSEVNGLVSSINQFIGIISFLEMGIGAVVQSALYKPIANKNFSKINHILSETQNFFRKLGFILVIYICGLIIFFPQITNSPFDFIGTGFLIFALSLRMFSEYFMGMTLQLFLNSAQLNYIMYLTSVFIVVGNTIISIFTIYLGFPIQFVKLLSGLIFMVKPLIMYFYVNRKFKFVNLNVNYESSAIPQKWNGIANQISYTVTNSTDIVVLTLFSSLENVSVYSVYNLVIMGLKSFISSLVGGIQSFFGTLIAQEKYTELTNHFSRIEWGFHVLVTFVYGMTSVLINSFALIYTSGVNDANYDVPMFGFILTVSQAIYCIRLPYNELTKAAGHFKQTQQAGIIEAALNVIISIPLVAHFGLIGVAIGTLIAITYRMLFLVFYLSKNILNRPVKLFIKQFVIDIVCFIFVTVVYIVSSPVFSNFVDWILYAALLALIYLIFILIINLTFNRKLVSFLFNRFLRKQ